MTIIANPIYDTVFKFLMEDNRVAKILLSALLQKEVVEVQMRQTEHTGTNRGKISMFRLDFSAKIRETDGTEHLVLIELQKTWLATETLRFRQYLGMQYLEEGNIPPEEENPNGFALPMISIYILGHKLGDLEEPVVYVRRRYLDQESKQITRGVPDPFIESLTHDTIIVQIPYLKGRVRNHLERLLNLFDQEYRMKENHHFLEIDEDKLQSNDEQLVMYRLLKAAVAPKVRREMQVEDEILSEIEKRDTEIMLREKEIKKRDRQLEQKKQQLKESKQQLEQKDQQLEKSKQQIEESKQQIEESKQQLEEKNQQLEEKNQQLEESKQQLEQKDQAIEQLLHSTISILRNSGLSIKEIARQLNRPEEDIKKFIS